jgi:soluble lytic murein transglycosylase
MKTFFWSGIMIFLLSFLLLIPEFPSMARSFFSRDPDLGQPVWSRRMTIRTLFSAFRGNRPACWFDGSFGLQQEMRKCLCVPLQEDQVIYRSGIPAIAYYDRFILNAGLRNHIDPALLKAIIWRESRFNHIARGEKGEVGLMQIMPGDRAAAADWAIAHCCAIPSEEELLNPELNIDIGAWYLARALHRYQNSRDAVALALCEYNAGPGRTEEWIPDPETPEESVFDLITISSTRKYVEDIMKRYDLYKNELNQQRNPL